VEASQAEVDTDLKQVDKVNTQVVPKVQMGVLMLEVVDHRDSEHLDPERILDLDKVDLTF